jgi:hypothetical protein
MGESARADRLETWAVATFNLVAFSVVLLTAGYASGGLSRDLADVGTLSGVALFGYLWALVLAATRWVLAGGGLGRDRERRLRSLAVRGVAGGAATGSAFLVGVLVVGALPRVVAGSLEPLSFGLIVLFGAVISAVVGGVVGLFFGLVDLGLYRAADRLVPARTA